MLCPVCGTENSGESKFCIKCGNAVGESGVSNSKPGKRRKKNFKMVLYVLLVVIVGAISFFIGRRINSTSQIDSRSINLTSQIDSRPIKLLVLIKYAQESYKNQYQSYGSFEKLYKYGFLDPVDMNKYKGLYTFRCVAEKTTYTAIAKPEYPNSMIAYRVTESGVLEKSVRNTPTSANLTEATESVMQFV